MTIASKLSKKYGERYYNKTYPNPTVERTGIPGLDIILGGGIPNGRIIQIVGQSSSCKTTLSLHIAKNYIDNGHEVGFVDCESTLTDDRLNEIQISKDKFHLFLPSDGADALNFAFDILEAGAKLVIIDSVPMLISQKVVNNEVGQLAIAPQARLLSQEQHHIIQACYTSNGTIIFINQMRQSIGSYGNPNIATGGKALQYMCSSIIETRRSDVAKDGSGVNIIAKTTKNKLTSANQSTEFFVDFPLAVIDKFSSMKDALEKKKLIIRGGSFFNFREDLKLKFGQEKSIQGGKGVVDFLRNNPECYNFLYDLVLEDCMERSLIPEELDLE